MSNADPIQCPSCKKRGDWFTTPFGPFCSKRCRLIDLGKWLAEEHAISGPLPPEAIQKLGELEIQNEK